MSGQRIIDKIHILRVFAGQACPDRTKEFEQMESDIKDTIIPRKTSECPPTEADGTKAVRGDLCVMAWDLNCESWGRRLVSQVRQFSRIYPYWMPIPPNPEEDNHD